MFSKTVFLRISLFAFLMVATPLSCLSARESNRRPLVIATMFPQYDCARRIAGDMADVRLIGTHNSDQHRAKPTPQEVRLMASADIVLQNGAMERVTRYYDVTIPNSKRIPLFDITKGIEVSRIEYPAEWFGDGNPGGCIVWYENDAHTWLDPPRAMEMVRNIANALSGIDSRNAWRYRSNAEELCEELEELDTTFRNVLAEGAARPLAFGGRFAFGYFFERYGLKRIALHTACYPIIPVGRENYKGFARNDAWRVERVKERILEHKIRYIFVDTQDDPGIAEAISAETGVKIVAVDSMHAPPSLDDSNGGRTYIDVMRSNLAAFSLELE